MKALVAKPYAQYAKKKIAKWSGHPHRSQQKVFRKLIKGAAQTQFGRDHDFENIQTYEDFVSRVPIRDYEGLKPYVERVKDGEPDVLWKGKPIYFAKTSGTTSGSKYIPITKASMPNQIEATKNAILMYVAETGNTDFVNGKMIFLQGSPELDELNGIKVGRLSGIVAHYVPTYLQKNRMPSWETNCIDDWETKVEAIIDETIDSNMTVIGGIPSWVQMYYERLHKRSGKPVGECFQNYQLFIYGGVNYEPYRSKFNQLVGRAVDSIELYPASEGFFAFQDRQNDRGMLLVLNAGIFYEFVKADEFFDENPKRIQLKEVELGVNYVMIISTNAGLWAYNLGDTIEFISLEPYRIIVSGRIKHFISAFGEHVIGKEVEVALQEGLRAEPASVSEFTVAPRINIEDQLPYHEWLIEFDEEPKSMEVFANKVDQALQSQNSYYFDLIDGKILQPLKITMVKKDGFTSYMKSIGKLGGQNKIPRLSNDRKIADALHDSDLVK